MCTEAYTAANMSAPIVNLAVLQLPTAAEDKPTTCATMREFVKRAVEQKRAEGKELQMVVLPVSPRFCLLRPQLMCRKCGTPDS